RGLRGGARSRSAGEEARPAGASQHRWAHRRSALRAEGLQGGLVRGRGHRRLVDDGPERAAVLTRLPKELRPQLSPKGSFSWPFDKNLTPSPALTSTGRRCQVTGSWRGWANVSS